MSRPPHRPGADSVGADSVGFPWAGRALPRQPFAGDDGSVDPALAAALAGYGQGTTALADVVRALAVARVLVPVVAVLGEDHPLPTHVRGDLGAVLAIATITGPDGRRGLPVFGGTASLAHWDRRARPVPVEGVRAALAAVAEGCDLLLLDLAGPVPVIVPRPAVWALGQSRSWVPPSADPELVAALRAVVEPVPDVVALRLEPLGDAGARLVLRVTAGLSKAHLSGVVAAVRAAIAEVDLLAERVDAVELKILPA
ncbi:MAG TPA: SseB family protein [Kineosporiaceae bacterium]